MKTKTLDSTKIYWLDKEETVKVKLVGLDMPHGFGSAKYTFRVLFGGAGDIVYMDSNLPKTIHEVVDGESCQFTTPIAMKCTEEQFNEIKGKLVEMVYKVNWFNWGGVRYLTTNYNSVMGNVDSTGVVYGRGRIIFETFNPDLFLALAAMTDKEDGIKGEWWRSTVHNEWYQGGKPGNLWRKATAQEIIEHFEKKEFVLPERWCVQIDDKNVDTLWSWAGFGFQRKSYINYVTYRKTHSKEIPEDCTEITSDQFKKYVLKEATQSCQIIPIPPTKQATLFDDRVEITDWKPKEGDAVWVVSSTKSSFEYKKYIFDASIPFEVGEKVSPFIKRTESEAKQLVEKLKQAML